MAAGLGEILRVADTPKGSFYHYFDSKEDFGRELITAYDEFFSAKLNHWLLNAEHAPLVRIQNFVDDATLGMERHGFRRGCLVGNLGQEMSALPESFRQQLTDVFEGWEKRLSSCLVEAQQAGTISPSLDCTRLASFFWIGWEGAVLRAKLERQETPLIVFAKGFFHLIQPTPNATDRGSNSHV